MWLFKQCVFAALMWVLLLNLLLSPGVMGLATARALQSLGYKVSGWSRTQPSQQQQQERAGIKCYAGQQQLQQFVSQQDVVVCLLPLTQETTGALMGISKGLPE